MFTVGGILETCDYFLMALVFLVAAVAVALVGFISFPEGGVWIGFTSGAEGVGPNVFLHRDWLIGILLLLPLSITLGFILVGALKRVFNPISDRT